MARFGPGERVQEIYFVGPGSSWFVQPAWTDPHSGQGVAHLVDLPNAGQIHLASSDHLIHFLLQGEVEVRWEKPRQFEEKQVRPGHVTVVPASEGNRMFFDGRTRALWWSVKPKMLRDVAEQELGCSHGTIELKSAFAVHDDALWHFGKALADELSKPGFASRLYVESLSAGLMVELLRRYSTLAREPGRCRGLSSYKLRAVFDYIDDNLAESLNLNGMAEVAGLSPYYFAKSFKEATGRPPHRYILDQRIQRAKHLLEVGKHSIIEIALSVGFSSQSHLTAIFRRQVGTTPRAYQAARN
jgi:AraC family transcriptional regulator